MTLVLDRDADLWIFSCDARRRIDGVATPCAAEHCETRRLDDSARRALARMRAFHGVETRRDAGGAVFHLCAACAERERRAASLRRHMAASLGAARRRKTSTRAEAPFRKGAA